MGIRRKVIILVGLTVIILMAVVYVMMNNLLLTSFLEVEEDHAVINVHRLDNAIKNNLDNLSTKAADWGRWDDSYNFVIDHNQEFVDVNLGPESLRSLNVNMMVYLSTSSAVVASRMVDYDNDDTNDDYDALPENLLPFFKSAGLIAKYYSTNTAENLNISSGIINLEQGPMLVVYGPILQSSGEGPVAGAIVIGQWLDQTMIEQISSTIQLDASLSEISDSENIYDQLIAVDDIQVGINYLSQEDISGSFLIDDVYGVPVIKASVIFPRVIYQEGVRAIKLFLLFYLLISLGIFGLIVLIIDFFILRRFKILNDRLNKIHASGELNTRINLIGRDEFSSLGHNIDSLLNELEGSHHDISEKDAKLAAESNRISKQNKDLEKAQLAMLNLLEDIDHEKAIIEETVQLRTKELSAEKAKLIASITSLPIGFAIIDQNKSIITYNDSLLKIFSTDSKSISFDYIADNVKGGIDFASAFDGAINKRLITVKDEISLEVKFIKLFVAPIISTTTTTGDDVIGCLILIEDITERKMIERTREEFFSIASHELRTPLTAIRGNMSMIKDFILPKVKNKDLADMIDDSYTGAIRLISIVNDFLDSSRLEQGKISLKPVAVNLAEVIAEVVKEVETLAVNKGLTIKINPVPAALPLALADRDRVKQVIFNLVGNAINYTIKGGVTIGLEQVDGQLKVSVVDTGAGISVKNQSRLFKKFQQAQEDVLARDVTKSTGLGLYISKMLIEAMGGKIGLESSVLGKGAVFSFTIPIAKDKTSKV